MGEFRFNDCMKLNDIDVLCLWHELYKFIRGRRGRNRMVVGLDLQLPMQSVPITINL
jgi:hypothetical protein